MANIIFDTWREARRECSRDREADSRAEMEQMLVVRIMCVANDPSSSCGMNSAPDVPMMNRDRANKERPAPPTKSQ